MSFLTQFHQVFFGRPLCPIPSTSHVIQRVTQSLSSLRSTCPNHLNLFTTYRSAQGHKLKPLLIIATNSISIFTHPCRGSSQFQPIPSKVLLTTFQTCWYKMVNPSIFQKTTVWHRTITDSFKPSTIIAILLSPASRVGALSDDACLTSVCHVHWA